MIKCGVLYVVCWAIVDSGEIYVKQSSLFQIGGDGDTFKDLSASQIAVSNASLTFFCNKN